MQATNFMLLTKSEGCGPAVNPHGINLHEAVQPRNMNIAVAKLNFLAPLHLTEVHFNLASVFQR
jgi:hypothetical protein